MVAKDKEADTGAKHAGERSGTEALLSRFRRILVQTAKTRHDHMVASAAVLKSAVPPRYKQAVRRAYLRVAAVTNAGSAVECPRCGTKLRRFARFHGLRDQCPGCSALMRHRALTLLLRDRLAVEDWTQARVIHIGPSRADAGWLGSRGGIEYVSVDLYSPSARWCRRTRAIFPSRRSRSTWRPVSTPSTSDDRQALREIQRVLRLGAQAVLQVPPSDLAETREDLSITDPRERERLFGQYDHVRLCGADYPARIADAGFEVERVDYVETLDEDLRRRYGLRTGEPFDLCVNVDRGNLGSGDPADGADPAHLGDRADVERGAAHRAARRRPRRPGFRGRGEVIVADGWSTDGSSSSSAPQRSSTASPSRCSTTRIGGLAGAQQVPRARRPVT